MGDTCNIKCNSNAIFYEYKDTQARTDKKPTNIYVDKGNNVTLPDKYKSVFEDLMSLDGDAKTLSSDDLALGKDIVHEYGIKEVRIDKNNGVSTFIFKDDSAISVDMKLNTEEQAERKLALAEQNGFSKYYDIQLSDDKKFFQVTVKDAGFLCTNPTLGVIKRDFGVRDNVFVKEGDIPYGNDDVIPESAGGRSFDNIKIHVGETINIPIEEINLSESPAGVIGRYLFSINY